MTRTIGSPLPNCGLESGDRVNLCGDVAPNDLVQQDPEELPCESDKWAGCRIEGTYLDGEIIKERAGFRASNAYHSPPEQTLDESGRYVALRVLGKGLDIPIREARFEKLVDQGVLVPVED